MITALYAGTMDPPTLGHLDIALRAARCCDRLYVGIGVNPAKRPFLPVEARLELLRADLHDQKVTSVEVIAFEGATIEFARAQGITHLVRGLRGVADLDHERGLAEINRVNGFETMLLLARSSYSHISAQLVRDVIAAGLSIDTVVSARVATALVRHGAIPEHIATRHQCEC